MIDIIIPTYKPGGELVELIEKLKNQTVKPHRIILMNTEESYFQKMLQEQGYVYDEELVEVHHISKDEFDHGNTRNIGVSYSEADIFVMMTQDALPADECFLENLVKPIMSDERIASSYARQLAGEGSSIVEQMTREFNYPEESVVKTKDDLGRLGIKTYFCSNVSCAYRKSVFEELGGFVKRAIFNEDMIYAAAVVNAGYAIAYSADARVYHSHNYTAAQQFHRNVDIGVSQADHPEVFEGISSESEGMKMVKLTISRLCRAGQIGKVIPYIYMTGCKYIGFKIGRKYKKLPLGFVKKCSMNPEYFD